MGSVWLGSGSRTKGRLMIFDFLGGALAFFYDIWPSYGAAIILFTLSIMLVLTPLSLKSSKSMIAMQRLAPEMKRLQSEHKNDRETLNREVMALYTEHGVSPFSSCLPLLIQMPVFMVLYRVLTGLTRIGADGNFNPKYLADDSTLASALRATNNMRSLGMDLSESALKTLQNDGVVTALPFLLLVGMVAASAYYQQRQISARNTGTQVNPQQQMVMKIMPAMFVFMSLSLPAGVVIYFVVSNLVRVAQQGWVTRVYFSSDTGKPRMIEARVVEEKSKPAIPKQPKSTDAPGDSKQAPKSTGASPSNTRRKKKKRK